MRLEGQTVIYFGMPFVMWALLAPSFRKQLTAVFGYDTERAKAITRKAKSEYRRIIAGLPEFEKGDRFKMNLVNAAMVGAQAYYEYLAGHTAGMELNACAQRSIDLG